MARKGGVRLRSNAHPTKRWLAYNFPKSPWTTRLLNIFRSILKSTNRNDEPRLALVSCVHNEERFLRDFLRYHFLLGVRRAYLFLDDCSDRTREIAESFEWVRTFEVDREKTKHYPYIADKQNDCANLALEWARNEGYDWLMHIDADEFAFADNRGLKPEASIILKGYLPTLLARVPRRKEIVKLRTREVLPTRELEKYGIWSTFCVQETDSGITRTISDPISGRVESWTGYLGHEDGKTIVRTGARLQSFNAHTWTRPQDVVPPKRPKRVAINTLEAGFHYHLVILDAKHWLKKYTAISDNPDVWHGGRKPVELPKRCWKNACVHMDAGAASAYVDKWVYLEDTKIDRYVKEGRILRENRVAEVLREGSQLEESV